MSITPKRRRPRFTLRTLFVVVTVFGLLAGWLVYQLNWIRERHELLATGRVIVDSAPFFSSATPPAVRAPGLLWVFGELGYPHIGVVLPWRTGLDEIGDDLTATEKAEIERVQRLFREATISSYGWPNDAEPEPPATAPLGSPPERLTTPQRSPYDGFKM